MVEKSVHGHSKYSRLTRFIPVFEKSDNGYLGIVEFMDDLRAEYVDLGEEIAAYRDVLEKYNVSYDSWGFLEMDVHEADGELVLAFIVRLYRIDHFSNGIFERRVADGTVVRWLKRLKEIDDEVSEAH